jgi:hypothetical protein
MVDIEEYKGGHEDFANFIMDVGDKFFGRVGKDEPHWEKLVDFSGNEPIKHYWSSAFAYKYKDKWLTV